MAQIFGDFSEQLSASKEYLAIVLSPSNAPLQERWKHNGLSANFMADYVSMFFPTDVESISTMNSKAEIKAAVSFIANELLENAMKFNDRAHDFPISITLQLHKDSLVFLASNSLDIQAVQRLQTFIQEIMANDPGDLLVRQLEMNAEDGNHLRSGLGILTMMSDYFARIGWKFETIQKDPEIVTVTTMVSLTA